MNEPLFLATWLTLVASGSGLILFLLFLLAGWMNKRHLQNLKKMADRKRLLSTEEDPSEPGAHYQQTI